MNDIKLIVLDLDGTLTQHKTKLEAPNKAVLNRLAERYKLLMAGAGQCLRIWNQMGQYPIDIIGNYGMQYAVYQRDTGHLKLLRDETIPCVRREIERRAAKLRAMYGLTNFRGESVEYHPSGCITFPILGTEAFPGEKLAYDPDRKKRRELYPTVRKLFFDYNVFIGGSSSFDMAPKPYDKCYALKLYCQEHRYLPEEVVFIGDDYGPGGNDASVYQSDFHFITVDHYQDFPKAVRRLL